jgi:Tol biopolymer transport system component
MRDDECWEERKLHATHEGMNMVFKKVAEGLKILAVVMVPLLGCKDEGSPIDSKVPCGGIDFGVVPEPPYDSPIWHPSGQFIGFNHTPLTDIAYPNGKGCSGVQHFNRDSAGFWLVSVDGTNKRRIFQHTLLAPSWSPDGLWIAFCLPIGGEVDVFKMRFTGTSLDTTTLVQLTVAGSNYYPTWSPDGDWIAYDRSLPDQTGPAGIWRMRIDGSSRQALQGGAFPTWHPDGTSLAYVGWFDNSKAGIITLDIQSGIKALLLDSHEMDIRHPQFSRYGNHIVFWSNGNLSLIDSLGNNLEVLTSSGVDVSFGLPFSCSPAGDKIVYTRHHSTDWTMTNGVLWLIDLRTKAETQLTSNP